MERFRRNTVPPRDELQSDRTNGLTGAKHGPDRNVSPSGSTVKKDQDKKDSPESADCLFEVRPAAHVSNG